MLTPASWDNGIKMDIVVVCIVYISLRKHIYICIFVFLEKISVSGVFTNCFV